MRLKPINEQVIVVFGASSGIGRITALELAKRGACVVVASRDKVGLDSLVNEIRQSGGEANFIAADASDFLQVKAVADHAINTYGTLDTWVHVAGIYLLGRFEDTTPKEFKRIVEVNLLGQAYGAMAALPHIRRTGRGALIHVSSVESKISLPLQSAYAASKHGIPGFLDALRIELREEGLPISVTNIMPASINTPLFSKGITKLGVKPKPAPPIYHPKVVADAIIYAAEHPVRELYAGGAGKSLASGRVVSSNVVDRVLQATMFKLQRSNERKSENAVNNFYEPVGDNRVEGDFTKQTRRVSAYTWLTTHPWMKGLTGLALLGVVLLSSRRALAQRNLSPKIKRLTHT